MKKASLPFVLLLILMLCSAVFSAQAEDPVVAIVNGQELLTSRVAPYEGSYLDYYASLGIDTTNEEYAAVIRETALQAAIEDMLVEQDMTALGCYDFSDEELAIINEQGNAAYQAALINVAEFLRSELELDESEDMMPYAEAYAAQQNVTADDYIQVYRSQYAYAHYYAALMADSPITEEDVTAVYEERVAAGQALYENDIPAFEAAVTSGEEVWYMPAGYRSILQILLPAEGATPEESLAAASDTLNAIDQALAAGESFQSLIARFGADRSFDSPSFLETGYQVHRESVVWDEAFVAAAFADELQQPGDHGKPFVSPSGIHILYYLKDTEPGAVPLTDELKEALTASVYTTRAAQKLSERLTQLIDSAEVVYP